MSHRIDIAGQRFGTLTAVKPCGINKNRKVLWECICDCGKQSIVVGQDLRRGKTKSCGCHGCSNHGVTKHNLSNTRIYRIWNGMKNRCMNPTQSSYRYYGGRGISVCDEWINSFDKFKNWAYANGYSDELTIDRIDVNGNYEPSNCRWVTMKEQATNKRKSLNKNMEV